MTANDRKTLVTIVVIVVIGGLVAWAGSSGSVDVGAIPLFAVCAAAAFMINWIAFVPAYLAQTEHYYDLTGSLTYLTLVALGLYLSSDIDARAGLVACLVTVWALRLGTFLFRRVKHDGGDGRFDKIKRHPLWFLQAWSLQGLWVLLTLACALAVLTTSQRERFDVFAAVGAVIWLAGFAIEVVADRQKHIFRADPSNAGRFITTGLWAWSRHPNYFGEIVLWAGIAVIAIPVLSGWRWLMLISPVFVYLLLTRVSGVPLLEARAKQRWGDDPSFQSYTAATPSLVPKPPQSG